MIKTKGLQKKNYGYFRKEEFNSPYNIVSDL